MPKASVLTIRMPTDLKQRIALIAELQGVSINQLAMYLLTKEIGNLEAGNKIATYWNDYVHEDILSGFNDVMAKIQERPVPDWDAIQ
jgi:hypothetical protein